MIGQFASMMKSYGSNSIEDAEIKRSRPNRAPLESRDLTITGNMIAKYLNSDKFGHSTGVKY